MFVDGHRDLEVFQRAFELSMRIFELTKSFPIEERYSLTDQIRRSSRSVCANLGEAWQKRRYEAAFIAKLSDAAAEAGETQVWLEFAWKCQYLSESEVAELVTLYGGILRTLHGMTKYSAKWCREERAVWQVARILRIADDVI